MTRYLEVTFRNGKPLAGYLYLPRRSEDRSARTVSADAGLLVDFAADGRAIGIEITDPSLVTLDAINRALAIAHAEPATRDEIKPLAA
jgi:uncharacterized protein YuzE